MKKFLLEIGTEEIPASFILPASERLKDAAEKKFKDTLIPFGAMRAFGTPRRLVLMADNVPDSREKVIRKVSGPPAKAAWGSDGKPTGALLGFAKKLGISPEQVKTEPTPKGDYLYAEIEEGGGKTADELVRMLPDLISGLNFPKTMKWGSGSVRFARPIRSIVAMLGKDTLSFELEGLRSGNTSFGHRFLHGSDVQVSDPDRYEEGLLKASVIVSPEKRKEIIRDGIDRAAKDAGCHAIQDEELLDTICYLTEFPIPVIGQFDSGFLDLPRELLITVMKHHQKYFGMEDAAGKITNHFAAVSNISCPDYTVIRKGYEQVLTARFKDARFFFEEDRKKSLEDFAAKLSGITYQKGLGTIADKVERIKKVALSVAEKTAPGKLEAVAKTAEICKADLVSAMVFEFPELQGIMGREYARATGLTDEVATAIDEHYRPRNASDGIPSSDVARCVALADKIDTICGFFALGKIPSGSEDPFSLRRHAIGITRILLSPCEGFGLGALIDAGIGALPRELSDKLDRKALSASIHSFFEGRIKAEFISKGYSYDVVDAVLAAGFDDIQKTISRADALEKMKKEEYCEAVSITFKRAANIVKDHLSSEVDVSALEEDAEKSLHAAIAACEEKTSKLLEKGDFDGALKEISSVRPQLDTFFDAVMVMVENDIIRKNRLGMLRRVVNLFSGVADFSRLVYT